MEWAKPSRSLYGTAVAGELGATHVLNNLKREFLYTLATLGVPKVAELSRDIIHAPHLVARTPQTSRSRRSDLHAI